MRMQAVTHDGKFHADDVVAGALLLLAADRQVDFRRTREPSGMVHADVVFDVGGEYSPERRRFDHHQPAGPVRDNGIPYSSAGLIFEWVLAKFKFGKEFLPASICMTNEEITAAVRDILEPTIICIDAADNGIVVEKTDLCVCIDTYVCSYAQVCDYADTNDDYQVAIREMYKLLRRYVITGLHKMKQTEAMTGALRMHPFDKRYIVLPPGLREFDVKTYGSHPNAANLLYVVYRRSSEDYAVKTIPANCTDPFTPRMNLPESWAGLNGADLAKVTGVEDAAFCHKGGFIATAKSLRGAIDLVELAVNISGPGDVHDVI